MVAISPNPPFPTDFTATNIENYAINVGVIFGGFIIAAIILSIVMMVSCCCFCCKKPKEGSQAWFKWIHLGTAAGIVVIAVVGCGVGWSYNALCNQGVNHMASSVSLLLNGSSDLIANVDQAINNLAIGLNLQVANTTQQFNFTGILHPMDEVVYEVAGVKNNTQGFAVLTNDMVYNTSVIKTDFLFMSNSSAANLTNVPTGSDIPDIDTSFSTSVSNANSSAFNLYDNIVNVRTTLNNTLTTISTQMLSQIQDHSNSYSNSTTSLTSNFNSIRGSLNNVNAQFSSSYQPQINHYSYVRTSVVSAILVLPISITIVALVGVFFRNTVVLKVCTFLSFLFFFWYMLIAGVNYTLYTVTNGFCNAESTIIKQILSSLNENATVGNNTFPLSSKVTELLQCSGNETLLHIFEADAVINELIGTVDSQTANIIASINNLTFGNQFSQANSDAQNFTTQLEGLNFGQNKNISSVQSKLNNNVATLRTLDNQAQAQFNNSIIDINSITYGALLNNGTTVYVIYTEYNVSSLNSSASPWNMLNDPNQQIDLRTNQTLAQNLFPRLVNLNTTLNYGIDAQNRVNALPGDIVLLNRTQYVIIGNMNGVQLYLGQVQTGINTFLSGIKNLINNLANYVISSVNGLDSVTSCSFVGSAYAGFNNGFCQQLSPSLQVIAAMMVLGAGSLFLTAIHSSIAIHRINGSEDDDGSAYTYDDEEKGKKNVSLQVRSSSD